MSAMAIKIKKGLILCVLGVPLIAGGADFVQVDPKGGYDRVPLAKSEVVVAVVQNLVTNMDQHEKPKQAVRENLISMEAWITKACNRSPKPDFILFNEFPLTGYSTKPRAEKVQMTITVPGIETRRLGKKMKECNAYLIFGSYARDKDWPGHILSINTVIGPDGKIKEKFWKTRNIKRFSKDGEIPTTTIEAVYDRYIKRYGKHNLFPVLKTEFGNIAVSTVQLDPFVFAAFAMRGAEIIFRTATLFSQEDVQATAYYHNIYSAMSNIIFPPNLPHSHYGGGSVIVSNKGKVMAKGEGNNEAIIYATIPIKEFRKNRTIPHYPLSVTKEVFDQYREEIPLNHLDMPSDKLPVDRPAMRKYFDSISNWKR